MKDQHTKITGYRDLTQDEINRMNAAKALEATAAAMVEDTRNALRESGRLPPQAARDLAMARTHFEDATIRLVRAVAQPESPWEPARQGGAA